jgi:hypothetical protein
MIRCFVFYCAREHPISFVPKLKKIDKVDAPDEDVLKLINLEFIMVSDNPFSTTPNTLRSSKIDTKSRGVEQVLHWLFSLSEIEKLMPLKKSPDKTRMF